MNIELHEITVRELFEGYVNNQEQGVFAYGGRLNIRPPYQREFVYDVPQRNAVIDTLSKGYPLNVMYWSVGDDGNYEVIDGQQRTLSICMYLAGDFSCKIFGYPDDRAFHNLPIDQREQLLNYRLTIYECEGSDSEKLAWFETINIAGEELTKQELRNAVYRGPWVTDAKRYFSRSGCAAKGLAEKYLSGAANRQAYLETAIKWIAPNGDINAYMSAHQHDNNATELWNYFQSVIHWVKAIFPHYRSQMKGINWGELYDRYHTDGSLDSEALEREIARLLMDDDVTNKKGIWHYVLSHDENKLSIRAFTPQMRLEAYERQQGICPRCGQHFAIEQMQADHITPWSKGGKTVPDNCQMLCADCNRRKSDL